MTGTLELAEKELHGGRFSDALAALSSTRSEPDTPSYLQEEILIAEALHQTGEPDEAARIARAGLKSNRSSPAVRARYLQVLALISFEKGEISGSLRLFRRAEEIAKEAQDQELSCRIRLDLIANLADLRGPEVAATALKECESRVATTVNGHIRARLSLTVAQLEGKRGMLDEAESHLRVAESYLATQPNVWLEGLLRLNWSTIHTLRANIARGKAEAERALNCAKASGHKRTEQAAIGNLAYLCLWSTDFSGARDRCAAGLRMSRGSSEVRVALLDTLAQLELADRNVDECRSLLSQIERETSSSKRYRKSWYDLATSLTRTRLHLHKSEWQSAWSLCGTGMRLAEERKDRLHSIAFRILGADALLESERFDEAARLVNEAAELASDAPLALSAEVERVQAAVLARTTDSEAARRRFDRALRILSSIGGIAPRMDASLSFQRTMNPSDDLIRAIREEPWNLEPLIAVPPQEAKADGKSAGEADHRGSAIDVSDRRVSAERTKLVLAGSSRAERESDVFERTNSSALVWLSLVLGLSGCAELVVDGAPTAEPPARPNFIILFADDQGYGDLGVFGATDFSTPRIDQMAHEGMKFTDFYAQPKCGPSRTALLTGSYPIRVGEFGNEKNAFPYVHTQEILLPAMLQQDGYTTGMIGKLDITQRRDGYRPELNPVRRGFDFWFGVVGANDSGQVHLVHRNEEMIEESAGVDDLTRRYTDEALAFIRRNEDRPFFLYVAHTMPHVALGVTEAFSGRSERGLYGDVIEELDASTGEIIDLIRELGLDQKTIVVYTSDNGPWSNFWRNWRSGEEPVEDPSITEIAGSAGPLRSAKGTTWEGGVRVPTVMWGPGYIPAGTETAEIATTMDLLPTFIEMAGAELPDDRTLDGRNISPLMLGEPGAASPHEALYYYQETHLDAVRSGPWKLVFPRPGQRDSEWLLARYGAFLGEVLEPVTELELYNLETDIGEQLNVASEHPNVVERLAALADRARQELGDYDRIGEGVRFFEDGPKWPRHQRWLTQ